MLRASALVALLVAGNAMASSVPAVHGATTFIVNGTGDQSDLNLANSSCDVSSSAGSQCTLRAAIEEANDTPGRDSIRFQIKSIATTKVIAPLTPLPPITDSVSINGYSQSGASPNSLAVGNNAVLKIVLDGVNAGPDIVGIEIMGNNSVITGLVIMRWGGAGISVSTGSRNQIRGNFIGTSASGGLARPNFHGVVLDGVENTLGGTSPAHRNLISGNVAHGVVICCVESIDNQVQGNYIGTRKSGSLPLGNGADGVQIVNAFGNTVGGTTAGAGNLISANGQDGIDIRGVSAEGGAGHSAVVAGNLIGTNASGTANLGNAEHGLFVSSSDSVLIGGASQAAPNVISANGGDGIRVSTSAHGVRISANQIFANRALGINLSGGNQNTFGVTANDTDDPDSGANNLQNFPVIRSARHSNVTGVTSVVGSLNGTPGTQFTVELFLAAADASGHGEGQVLIESQGVTTNSGGDIRFAFQTSALQPGHVLTATATAATGGDTSEFALNLTVVTAP